MWSPVNPFNAMLSRHRRGAFLFCRLGFPFRGCLIAERNKGITPFLRFSGLIVVCRVLCTVTINHYGE